MDTDECPSIQMRIEQKSHHMSIMDEEAILVMCFSEISGSFDDGLGELTEKICFVAMIDLCQKLFRILRSEDKTLCHIEWDEDDIVCGVENILGTCAIIPDIEFTGRGDITSLMEASTHSDDIFGLCENTRHLLLSCC